MQSTEHDRARETQLFEFDAEVLAVYQLDLLAELERQLRAVHHTMRHIEKLRAAKHRVGPELSNSQRHSTLAQLDDEVAALDEQLSVEHTCCAAMQELIGKMQARVSEMRQRAAGNKNPPPDSSQSGATSEGA